MQRFKLTMLVLVLMAAMLPLASHAQKPGMQYYRAGAQLQRQGNCEGAIEEYNKAITAEPTEYRYYFAKGMCEAKLKQYDAAIRTFRQTVQVNPAYTIAYVRLAQLYMAQRNYNGAIEALNSAYDNEQDQNRKLLFKMYSAKLLLKLNRPQEAQAELNKVKRDAPEDPRVLALEGDIYSAMNNYNQAISSYQAALSKMQDQPKTQTAQYYYKLGLAYFNAGDRARADEAWKNVVGTRYEQAVKSVIARSSARYFVAIAYGYYKAQMYEKALQYANEAVQKEPNNPLGYQLLGMVQVKQGQNQVAIANLNKAADNTEDDRGKSKLYGNMIKLQMNNGDYRGALATADRILANAPENVTVMSLKAQALYQLGQYRECIELTQVAIPKATNVNQTGELLFLQGQAAKKAGDTQLAREAFGKIKGGSFALAARKELEELSAR